MGRSIHEIYGSALRILIAWLLAVQPMTAAYAAAAVTHAPLALELCRGAALPETGAPGEGTPAQHSPECCLACAPTPAAPPVAAAEPPAPAGSAEAAAPRAGIVFVAKAGIGPQSARAPPL